MGRDGLSCGELESLCGMTVNCLFSVGESDYGTHVTCCARTHPHSLDKVRVVCTNYGIGRRKLTVVMSCPGLINWLKNADNDLKCCMM